MPNTIAQYLTCDCVIEFTSTNPPVYVRTISTCNHPDHLAARGKAAHLSTLVAHSAAFSDYTKQVSDKSDKKSDAETRLNEKGEVEVGDTPKERHQKWLAVQACLAERERIRKL